MWMRRVARPLSTVRGRGVACPAETPLMHPPVVVVPSRLSTAGSPAAAASSCSPPLPAPRPTRCAPGDSSDSLFVDAATGKRLTWVYCGPAPTVRTPRVDDDTAVRMDVTTPVTAAATRSPKRRGEPTCAVPPPWGTISTPASRSGSVPSSSSGRGWRPRRWWRRRRLRDAALSMPSLAVCVAEACPTAAPPWLGLPPSPPLPPPPWVPSLSSPAVAAAVVEAPGAARRPRTRRRQRLRRRNLARRLRASMVLPSLQTSKWRANGPGGAVRNVHTTSHHTWVSTGFVSQRK